MLLTNVDAQVKKCLPGLSLAYLDSNCALYNIPICSRQQMIYCLPFFEKTSQRIKAKFVLCELHALCEAEKLSRVIKNSGKIQVL